MKTFSTICVVIAIFILSACRPDGEGAERTKFRIEIEAALKVNLLETWYPLTMDTVYGGFLSDFTYDWQLSGQQHKMIVTQARHVWTTSQASMFYDDGRYAEIAAHGFRFLLDRMWDNTYGGFYTLRDRQGNPLPGPEQDYKTAYGNAFGIYSLASYYKMSNDTAALNLARETFRWLDTHSYDRQYKGYVDRMARDGSWLYDRYLKDQNSSIHLLEAFTELYQVWPDSLLRERLSEILYLIRDTQIHESGYVRLFFNRDWTPVSFRDSSDTVREAGYYYDHISFGHDVEIAYLMLEASHVLGFENDSRTLAVAKKLVDHALAHGWDDENGGFYYQGYYYSGSDTMTIINKSKTWWVQAEGLNALLLMSELFPRERIYFYAFTKLWKYIDDYLIDHTFGGWYMEGLDNSPHARTAPKAFIWKVNYHDARALMNCIKKLQSGSP
jgi:cellobiose epimerase